MAARGYDRLNQFDSARTHYLGAADRLPAIADWLRLRAAGVTADSAARATDYAAITNPAAAARITWTEAEARERTGDLLGAAHVFATIGARLDALRDSAAAAVADTDTTARTSVRASVVGVISSRPGSADARAAIDLADRFFAPLSAAEELVVARSAGVSGPAARAAAAYDRVVTAQSLDALAPRDLLLYGSALARLHRDADATRIYGSLATRPAATVPPAVAHLALYQRGRALVAGGDLKTARQVLQSLVRAAPRDTAAASARMLLADLATDDGDFASARRDFLDVARRFPTTALAPRARFRAALLAFVAASPSQAAREWDEMVARYPHAEDSTAARYWSGRAWANAGRRRSSIERWRYVLAHDPLSYYAILSARRLGAQPPLARVSVDTAAGAYDPCGGDSTRTRCPLPPALDSAIDRAALLEALGMEVEAKFEVDRTIHAAGDAPSTLSAAGMALAQAGEMSRAVSIGWHLLGRSDSAWRDARVLRLIYPLAYGDTLARDARERGLDPALVAAIVRQESAFNPRAVSVVGARGLMQLMPSVGRGLAESHRWDTSDPDLLDRPEVNLALGTAHLATFLAQEKGNVVRTLAAYNAGPSRVAAWATKRGVDDPEMFVERIPFTETRDYVRTILRAREAYAHLYGL
jgi:soluble lytic murein transglycosylase